MKFASSLTTRITTPIASIFVHVPALLFVLLFSNSGGIRAPLLLCRRSFKCEPKIANLRSSALLLLLLALFAATRLHARTDILKKDTGNNFHGQHFTLNKFITFMIEFASSERQFLHMYRGVSRPDTGGNGDASLHKQTLVMMAKRRSHAWPAAVDTISSSVLLLAGTSPSACFACSAR